MVQEVPFPQSIEMVKVLNRKAVDLVMSNIRFVVSATLVKIPGYGSIMLDAGEGTYGQMMRRFGIERLDDEMRALRCIFISHLHADHHLGVVQLINKWNKVNLLTDVMVVHIS